MRSQPLPPKYWNSPRQGAAPSLPPKATPLHHIEVPGVIPSYPHPAEKVHRKTSFQKSLAMVQ